MQNKSKMAEEALQKAVKRREAKSKGEKERYTHLNAELQRIARRDKKAFLSYQCNEIEENNRIGKTRDLFKKIGDTKGKFPEFCCRPFCTISPLHVSKFHSESGFLSLICL